VIAVYNDCIQAQAELHKATRRLQRLKAMKLELTELGSESVTEKSRINSKLDRWTRGGNVKTVLVHFDQAEQLSFLLINKERLPIIKDRRIIENLFRNFCIFG